MDNRKAISTLNGLIETCRDGARGRATRSRSSSA